VPVLVYCAYCGQVVARYRTLMTLSEIERRTLQRYRKCPHCGSTFTRLDIENIMYEIKKSKSRTRQRTRAKKARARSVRVL